MQLLVSSQTRISSSKQNFSKASASLYCEILLKLPSKWSSLLPYWEGAARTPEGSSQLFLPRVVLAVASASRCAEQRVDARSGPVSPPFQLVPQAPASLHSPGSAPAPRPPNAVPPGSILHPPSPTHAGHRLHPGATRRQQHPESPGALGHPHGGGGDRGPGSARALRLTCLGARRRRGKRARGAERKSWPRLARPPREAAPGGAPWRRDRVPACAGRAHTWPRALNTL